MRLPPAVAIVLLLLSQAAAAGSNPTAVENTKSGDSSWVLHHPAVKREIDGYASKTSVNRGEQIELFVHTSDSSYTIEVFRMGWYGGAGGRRVFGPVEVPGTVQATPLPDPITGLIECDWKNPFVLSIPYTSDPTDWASGVYLVKLTARPTKADAYIHFIVRDDARRSDFLFQSSITTYQAYNAWGGKSMYRQTSADGIPARKVSFNRPYDVTISSGAGHFVYNGGWEYTMVRFLEREGYDVTYCTNIDVHENPALLVTHKAFLSVGHDEYWSWEMRANIQSARDRGVHLGIFSANTCYWQIRLEPSGRGAALRTIVGYKERALLEDPYALDGNPSNDHLVTTKWRSAPVNRPERSLLGVMYIHDPVAADIVIENPSHWVFERTNSVAGTRLPNLLGYEVDAMGPESPPGTVRLAHSPFLRGDGTIDHSDMSIYQAPSGAFVFATGSIWWSYGLDNFNSGSARADVTHPIAQQITRNVLNRFAGIQVTDRRRSARH